MWVQPCPHLLSGYSIFLCNLWYLAVLISFSVCAGFLRIPRDSGMCDLSDPYRRAENALKALTNTPNLTLLNAGHGFMLWLLDHSSSVFPLCLHPDLRRGRALLFSFLRKLKGDGKRHDIPASLSELMIGALYFGGGYECWYAKANASDLNPHRDPAVKKSEKHFCSIANS